MNESEEVTLMDYLRVIWRRKWLILLPSLLLALTAMILSSILKPKWEVDMIIQPSKFLVQTQDGKYEEVIAVSPAQIARQINERSYNNQIASELNLDKKKLPKYTAENLKDTNLIRVFLREKDANQGEAILRSLFNIIAKRLDQKIDVETKSIDAQIVTAENAIKKTEMDVQSKEIEKNSNKQKILASTKKLAISQERVQSISEEMKAAKKRIDELEAQQKEALLERQEGRDAISLLLYANEVQNNLRYYNTLDEKVSYEKVVQENFRLEIKETEGEIKQLDTQIEKLKNEMADMDNQIALFKEKKGRIDYAQMIKEPTPSLQPVSPKKKLNVLMAGFFGLTLFTLLAFFLEYLKKQMALDGQKP